MPQDLPIPVVGTDLLNSHVENSPSWHSLRVLFYEDERFLSSCQSAVVARFLSETLAVNARHHAYSRPYLEVCCHPSQLQQYPCTTVTASCGRRRHCSMCFVLCALVRLPFHALFRFTADNVGFLLVSCSSVYCSCILKPHVQISSPKHKLRFGISHLTLFFWYAPSVLDPSDYPSK